MPTIAAESSVHSGGTPNTAQMQTLQDLGASTPTVDSVIAAKRIMPGTRRGGSVPVVAPMSCVRCSRTKTIHAACDELTSLGRELPGSRLVSLS